MIYIYQYNQVCILAENNEETLPNNLKDLFPSEQSQVQNDV